LLTATRRPMGLVFWPMTKTGLMDEWIDGLMQERGPDCQQSNHPLIH
jgi:hypothetical protein